MQDSRLIQAVAELGDAKALLAEILDEGPRDPHDVVALVAAQKFLSAAVKQIRAAITPVEPVAPAVRCKSWYGFSSYCRLAEGHDGLHTNGHWEWDDARAERSHQSVVKAMKGNTE